jgi:hypothetical protein
MDKEYETALMEIKEATALKTEILRNITQIKLPKGFSITFEKEWIFPGDRTFKARRFGTWLCLRENGNAIGLLNFNISPENKIEIHEIHGVKRQYKTKPPKDWAKTLTDSFILACLPRLVKDNRYKIHYDGQNELNEDKFYLDKLKTDINDPKISVENKQKIKEMLTIAENKKKIIKMISERYFDKEGFLNPRRLRVQNLESKLLAFSEIKYEKPKQSPYKRRKLTRIKAKPKLA